MPFNIRTAGEEAEQHLIAEMDQNDGRVPVMEFSDEVVNGGRHALREMIGTDDGAAEFVEKTTFDMAAGREAVPLIYRDIYRTITDANFPRKITAKEFGSIEVVFLQKLEGGEVTFGTMGAGKEKTVTFETWAAGIEYDEDIVEYNETWRVAEIGEAFGEAYNRLLNHMHLNPIITGSYITTGGGLAAQAAKQKHKTAPAAQLIAFDTSIAKTLLNALQVLPSGSIVLCNSFDIPALEDGIASAMLTDLKPSLVKRTLSPANLLPYDGVDFTVGGQSYSYGGVPQGFVVLVVPRKNFVEYVKHDLRVDSDDGDLSRLILSQVVGRTRRTLFAGIASVDGAIKIDIAA